MELPWETLEGNPVSATLMLTTQEGEALSRITFNRRVWAPALKRTGVEQTRDDGMHACRHFFASVLLDAGESIKVVSDYLGNSDPGFTLRIYTHPMPNGTERTKRAVDDALSCYIGATSRAL